MMEFNWIARMRDINIELQFCSECVWNVIQSYLNQLLNS